jgi:hypothetical protein
MKLKLIDNVENKSYIGSYETIKRLLNTLYKQYKHDGILKGVAFANNTWYIG